MSCECRTGNFHIHFSITSEGALQFSLWDAFYWAYLHFGRCVKGGKKNALKKKRFRMENEKRFNSPQF